MEISLANPNQINGLTLLFDEYRVFYQQASDPKAVKKFLRERFDNNDSILLAATDKQQVVGFAQLYPSFSSVQMRRLWIVNDLFVAPSYRNKGIAKALMDAARKLAEATEAFGLTLATQTSNEAAQKLYESLGYVQDHVFKHYILKIE